MYDVHKPTHPTQQEVLGWTTAPRFALACIYEFDPPVGTESELAKSGLLGTALRSTPS